MSKLVVTLHGLDRNGEDEVLGTVWMEDGNISTDITNEDMARNIMAVKIYLPGQKPLTRDKKPEQWLRNLYKHYKSPYLRASEAVEK